MNESLIPFRILWVGRCGFGLVWRGVEHQFYRDVDGSMGKPWTHHNCGRWAPETPDDLTHDYVWPDPCPTSYCDDYAGHAGKCRRWWQ